MGTQCCKFIAQPDKRGYHKSAFKSQPDFVLVTLYVLELDTSTAAYFRVNGVIGTLDGIAALLRVLIGCSRSVLLADENEEPEADDVIYTITLCARQMMQEVKARQSHRRCLCGPG